MKVIIIKTRRKRILYCLYVFTYNEILFDIYINAYIHTHNQHYKTFECTLFTCAGVQNKNVQKVTDRI